MNELVLGSIDTIKTSVSILMLSVLFSCTSEDNDVDHENSAPQIFTRSSISEAKPQELFERLSKQPQSFQINMKKDTTIIAEHGTKVTIPENSFIDKDGNPITGDVTLELIEASSMLDYLKNDLQTTSNGKLLQSAGMIYIDAKVNDESVFLEEHSALRVEMPTTVYAQEEYQIFSGEHDDQGNINWVEMDDIYDFLIPLPLSEFDYKYYTKYSFPTKQSSIKWLDSLTLNDPKYENTFLATREFQLRFKAMNIDDSDWWEEYENGFGNDRIYGKAYNINCPLLDVYLQNIDKPLWYSDSIAHEIYKAKDIRDSIDLFTNHGWNESHYFHGWSNEFKRLYKLKQTNVKKYDLRRVDVSQPNSLEKLIVAGYSRREAKEQLYIHRERERILEEIQRWKNRVELSDTVDETIATSFTRVFNTTSLGWINVDKFYDDPLSKEVELFANIISDSLGYSDVTLIIPNRNIAINGIELETGKFTFTQDSRGYRKLPVGESALVVAISVKNEVPYLGMEKFEIKEEQNIDLQMVQTTWAALVTISYVVRNDITNLQRPTFTFVIDSFFVIDRLYFNK